MEQRSTSELIISGFWFGVGMMPAVVAAVFGATYLSLFYANDDEVDVYYDEGTDVYQEAYESYFAGKDTNEIVLGEYRQSMQGKQLLISGSFTNNNKISLNSLEIEAELFDAEGTFVFECSESIYRKIDAGHTENYQIRCGCSENGVPDFETVTVRVVSAG